MINRELFEGKYWEMKARGLTEDSLDFDTLGEAKVFINHKPKFTLCSLEIDADVVYFGAEYLFLNDSSK